MVEEKRQILEYALKEELYNWRDDVRPRVYGKFDERERGLAGVDPAPRGLLAAAGAPLSCRRRADRAGDRRCRLDKDRAPSDALRARIAARLAVIDAKEREAARPTLVEERKPWFCSGCPHNTSTRVPEGSRALAGIGCHYATACGSGRRDQAPSARWAGGASHRKLGQKDFTSGHTSSPAWATASASIQVLLAVRMNRSRGTRRPSPARSLCNSSRSRPRVAGSGGRRAGRCTRRSPRRLRAEGVAGRGGDRREPEKCAARRTSLARRRWKCITARRSTTCGARCARYRQLCDGAGHHDQACATESATASARGDYPIGRRAFINGPICEGCGDCSLASPTACRIEAAGSKRAGQRRVNRVASCSKDFSCRGGFCASFVDVRRRARRPA